MTTGDWEADDLGGMCASCGVNVAPDYVICRLCQIAADEELDGTALAGDPDDLALEYGYETTDWAEHIEAFGGEEKSNG